MNSTKDLEILPINLIFRKPENYKKSEINNLMTTLSGQWIGADKSNPQTQRSPFVTNDIITFCYDDDGKLCVLGGWWEKTINGVKIAGKTIVPGGHFERMGNRNPTITMEHGDLNFMSSALKELWEETNIDPKKIKNVKPLCLIDLAENDPRAHVLRMIWLATTNEKPKSTDEIKEFYYYKLSELPDMIKNNSGGFVLNHDKMLEIVLGLPDFKKYVKNLKKNKSKRNKSKKNKNKKKSK